MNTGCQIRFSLSFTPGIRLCLGPIKLEITRQSRHFFLRGGGKNVDIPSDSWDLVRGHRHYRSPCDEVGDSYSLV